MSDVRNEIRGEDREPPVESGRRRVSLPSNRAFVVQFRAEAGPGVSFSGRFEHVASGRVQGFGSSLELITRLTNALGELADGRRSDTSTNSIRNQKED